MALRDILARFAIEVEGGDKLERTDKQLKSALNNANGFVKELRGMTRWFGAGVLVNAIRGFVSNTIQMADELKHNAENLGLTTDELQKFQYVASVMQVPTQQAVVAFRFFNRAIGEVAMGTKSTTKYFNQMGLQIKDSSGHIKPTDQLLMEFSDKLAAIPDQSLRTAYAMRALGRGGASMLPVLQKGSGALREMFSALDALGMGFDKDFVEKAHELDVQQKLLAFGWRSMRVAIVKELLPALTKWTAAGIKNVKILLDTAKHSYAIRTALLALVPSVIFVAGVMKAAFLPQLALFTALAAAVFGAYIVFDDFYTFLKGGDSVIGRHIDKMGGDSKGIAASIRTAFQALVDAILPATNGMRDFHKSFVGVFIDGIPHLVKWGSLFILSVVTVLDTAVTEATHLWQLLNLIANTDPSFTFKKFQDDWMDVENSWRARRDLVANLQAQMNELANPTPGTKPSVMPKVFEPEGPVGPSGTVSGTPMPLLPLNVTNYVEVKTNADPKAIGNAIGQATGNAVRKAFRAAGAGTPQAAGAN